MASFKLERYVYLCVRSSHAVASFWFVALHALPRSPKENKIKEKAQPNYLKRDE